MPAPNVWCHERHGMDRYLEPNINRGDWISNVTYKLSIGCKFSHYLNMI